MSALVTGHLVSQLFTIVETLLLVQQQAIYHKQDSLPSLPNPQAKPFLVLLFSLHSSGSYGHPPPFVLWCTSGSDPISLFSLHRHSFHRVTYTLLDLYFFDHSVITTLILSPERRCQCNIDGTVHKKFSYRVTFLKTNILSTTVSRRAQERLVEWYSHVWSD